MVIFLFEILLRTEVLHSELYMWSAPHMSFPHYKRQLVYPNCLFVNAHAYPALSSCGHSILKILHEHSIGYLFIIISNRGY